MTLHVQASNILKLMAALGEKPLEEMTPTESREMILRYQIESDEPIHEVRNLMADSVPVRLYSPAARSHKGLCVFFHGGGWVFGTLDGYEDVCRRLANISGTAILSVDYRLAPEFPFPIPLNDCLKATRWASDNATLLGIDPGKILVCGDSAGGNLATLVAQHSGVLCQAQILIYPVTDARCGSGSYVENASGYRLTSAGMKWFINHYLAGDVAEANNHLVSPLLAEDSVLAKLPKTVVLTAEYDPLRDEGEEYARRLSNLGVPTTLTRYFGQIHGFFSMSRFLDDGHHALAQVGSAIRLANSS